MTATGMFLWASLRRRRRPWLVLALLIGVFAGVVTAAAAGARRTDGAYPELLRYSKAPDVLLFSFAASGPGPATFADVPPARFIALPQVTQGAALTGYTVANPADVSIVAPADQGIPGVFWHRKLLAGRLPDPRRADEVDVSFTVAQVHHVRVGGWLPLTLLGRGGGTPVSVRLRVVGIDAAPSEFPPQFGSGVNTVWATPAFNRVHRGQRLDTVAGAAPRLQHGGASIPAVEREAQALAKGQLALTYGIANQSANTLRSIHLQAVALWLLAALLAAVGLLIAGQLLARLAAAEARAHGSLLALGMTRLQLLAAGLGRSAVIGAEAGAAAVLIAVALSPLFPVGLAATADPHPGVRADVPALAAGFILTVLLVVAAAAGPVWRSTGRHDVAAPKPVTGKRPVLARALAALRPVSAAVGVRLALQRGAGRSAVPVSSTLAGAGIGVAALTAALVFASSFTHLTATPRLYGTTWDASVATLSSMNGKGVLAAVPVVAGDREVAAWSVGYSGVPLGVNGTRVDALAMNPAHGQPITTPLLSGRLPRRAGEIVLGARSLAAVHTKLGGTVRVSLGSGRASPLRVVGVAVFPELDDSLDLGKGAEVTISQLAMLLPPGAPRPPYDHLFVRFQPGAGAAALAVLARRLTVTGPFAVQGPTTPADVVNFGQVQNLPLVLGGCFGALALLTIAHLLVTSARGRRRDIAVLRAVGFSRRQVRAAVAWQSATLMAVSLAVGIPVGMICGRQIWLLLTRQLGVLPAMDVPALALMVLVVAAVPLAVAIAAWPGEAAARISPALALRAE